MQNLLTLSHLENTSLTIVTKGWQTNIMLVYNLYKKGLVASEIFHKR